MNGQDYDFRFSGIKRLLGEASQNKIHNSHVLIVGLGGVGSWVVESLARSGVGHLTLMDFDDICLSNINRQSHATSETVGQLKSEVLRKRVLSINPEIQVDIINESYSKDMDPVVFKNRYHSVVDAIDSELIKQSLAIACREHGAPLIVAGSAGGRIDATQVRVADLSKTTDDPMLAMLRKNLRRKANFPRRGKMGITCVYSLEKPRFYDQQCGVTTSKPESFLKPLDCSSGFGTISHVTGVFGFFIASQVIAGLVEPLNNGA